MYRIQRISRPSDLPTRRTNTQHLQNVVYIKTLSLPTYPHKWIGHSASRRTYLRTRRTPRSGLYRWRRSRSASTRPDWRVSKVVARLPASYLGTRAPEAGGQRLSEGIAPGLRPRRILALRAWWCRLRSPGWNAVARACVKGRGSDATELGSGQAAALRHWPGGLGAGSEGPATSTDPPHSGGKSFSCTVGKKIRWAVLFLFTNVYIFFTFPNNVFAPSPFECEYT